MAASGAMLQNEGASDGVLERNRQEQGIKYFLISFVDLFGTMRAKIVPASAIDGGREVRRGLCRLRDLVRHDAGRSGRPGHARSMTLIRLPWKPEVAWVTGDLVMGGEPVEQNPRQVLKRVVARPRSRASS